MDILPMQPLPLKPCPFCGGKAIMMKRAIGVPGTQGYDWWHSVGCLDCNGGVGYDDNRFREKEAALKAWNRRYE